MKSHRLDARPRTIGFPVMPKQMAQTTVDFPVPFGPMMTFKLGPGRNSNESYVLNLNWKENILALIFSCFSSRKSFTQSFPI